MEFRILISPVPRWNPLTPALQGTLQEAGEVGLISLGLIWQSGQHGRSPHFLRRAQRKGRYSKATRENSGDRTRSWVTEGCAGFSGQGWYTLMYFVKVTAQLVLVFLLLRIVSCLTDILPMSSLQVHGISATSQLQLTCNFSSQGPAWP